VQKYCTHCKRAGHSRNECWTLYGRPEKTQGRPQKINSNKKQKHITALVKKTKKRNENSDSLSSSGEENEEEETQRKKSPAQEYKVTQIKGKSHTKTGLNIVTLPIQETKGGKTSLLLDGATLTLIKLRNLKDETPVREERVVRIGVTRHKTHTIRKIRATNTSRTPKNASHNIRSKGQLSNRIQRDLRDRLSPKATSQMRSRQEATSHRRQDI